MRYHFSTHPLVLQVQSLGASSAIADLAHQVEIASVDLSNGEQFSTTAVVKLLLALCRSTVWLPTYSNGQICDPISPRWLASIHFRRWINSSRRSPNGSPNNPHSCFLPMRSAQAYQLLLKDTIGMACRVVQAQTSQLSKAEGVVGHLPNSEDSEVRHQKQEVSRALGGRLSFTI